MIIYPAVDIKDGHCVRLYQGKFDQVTNYGTPVDAAKRWCQMGAQHLHVVDLDGAKQGHPINLDKVEEICNCVSAKVRLGGGMRTIDDIQAAFAVGVSEVVIGTKALLDLNWVKEAVGQFGNRIVCGIDAMDGKIATHAWEQVSHMDCYQHGQVLAELGIGAIIYTDISRDGALTGPNLPAMSKMAQLPIPVIASGGVSKTADIEALKQTGVIGVIVGKALYTGDVDLKEAIALCQ